MNTRYIWAAVLVCVFALGGCASPARVDQMVTSGQPGQRVAQSQLRGNVAVSDVTGGKETNPMWKSSVGSDDFMQALEGSLRTVGLLAPTRQSGLYSLTAHLQNLDQPNFGFDMTVTASVLYAVVERKTGKEIFRKTIAVPYTAKMGDAFSGTERLKLANEGAIRTNITQLIDELFGLKIEGISVGIPGTNNEEKLKELKRLKDAGLISNDVYVERQKVILGGN